MNIKTLSLLHFRNFPYVEKLEFPNGALLVAAAPNATGKTNFLESLVVLLRGKSFRSSLEECVTWGEEEAGVRGVVQRLEGETHLGVSYNRKKRTVALEENGEPVSPVTLYARYGLVLFLPEDTFLFDRGPGARRNFLNQVLVSRPTYVSALVQYQRVLRQRNAALKTAESLSDIETWTQLLAQYADRVWQERRRLADFLASHMERVYQEISGEERSLEVRLQLGARQPEEFQKELAEAWEIERKYHYTLAGPHRDDVEIVSEGRPVAAGFSRGQMRSLTGALKIASWHFLEQVTGEKPLLLLDEVLSELDEVRRRQLLTHLPEAQILLTCTRVPKVLLKRSDVHLLDLRAMIQEDAPKIIKTPAREASVVLG